VQCFFIVSEEVFGDAANGFTCQFECSFDPRTKTTSWIQFYRS
jgi:hypothetical protein